MEEKTNNQQSAANANKPVFSLFDKPTPPPAGGGDVGSVVPEPAIAAPTLSPLVSGLAATPEATPPKFTATTPPVGFAPEPAAPGASASATPAPTAVPVPPIAAPVTPAVPATPVAPVVPKIPTPPTVPVALPISAVPAAPTAPTPAFKPLAAPASVVPPVSIPVPETAPKTPAAPFGFDTAQTPFGFAPAPRPAAGAEEKKKPEELPAVRTFRGDISEYTAKSQTTYFDIVAQAGRKKPLDLEEGAAAGMPRNTKIIIGAGGGVLLLIMTAGAYLLFARPSPQAAEQSQIARAPQPIIFADYEKVFNYSGDKQKLVSAIQGSLAVPLLTGEFTYLPIKATELADEYFAGPADFLKFIGANPPAALLSYAAKPFTFGYIDAYGRNETVIIFRITDYERFFASLLGWENSMVRDLSSVWPKTNSLSFGENTFKDIVVKNHDARVLSNLENKPIMAYAIFNRKLAVIASSKTALEIVLERLISSPPNI